MNQDFRILEVQRIFQFTCTDKSKVLEALQAPGASFNHISGMHFPEGNKRLALIGDSALRMALVVLGYKNSEYRGSTQATISSVVCNANLANVGRQHRLDEYINPAAGATSISNGTLADTVEAIFGAVYLEGGLSAVSNVMASLGLLPETGHRLEV